MLETVQNFMDEIKNGPTWIYVWLNFLSIVLMASVFFVTSRREARWVLISFAFVFPTMILFYSHFGMQKILGIVHVVYWTPLLIWLWRRRSTWQVSETLSGKWIALAFAVITVSLAFDYTDVIRWLLGERSVGL